MCLYSYSTCVITVSVLVICLTALSSPQEQESSHLTIGLAGDTMLGRLVNEAFSGRGYSYPWGTMQSELARTDFNLVNLENTFTRHTIAVPKVFNFKADPDKVQSLVDGHVNIVNLANNHSLDFGVPGLIEMLNLLKSAGIAYVGAGLNDSEAQQAVIIKCKGITLGILGVTDNEPSWKAGCDKPGTNFVRVGDIDAIKKMVDRIRSQVDVIILSMHWGPNMRQIPTKEFVDFAHNIIDCGVDIIHGHSAHIIQGIEFYKDKLILYDTGDFVDDYAVDMFLRNDRACFFVVDISGNRIVRVKIIPTIINDMQVNKALGNERDEILRLMQRLSKQFGTEISNDGFIERGSHVEK